MQTGASLLTRTPWSGALPETIGVWRRKIPSQDKPQAGRIDRQNAKGPKPIPTLNGSGQPGAFSLSSRKNLSPVLFSQFLHLGVIVVVPG